MTRAHTPTWSDRPGCARPFALAKPEGFARGVRLVVFAARRGCCLPERAASRPLERIAGIENGRYLKIETPDQRLIRRFFLVVACVAVSPVALPPYRD